MRNGMHADLLQAGYVLIAENDWLTKYRHPLDMQQNCRCGSRGARISYRLANKAEVDAIAHGHGFVAVHGKDHWYNTRTGERIDVKRNPKGGHYLIILKGMPLPSDSTE